MKLSPLLLALIVAGTTACVSPVTEGLDAYADADYSAAHASWSWAATEGDLDATFLLATLYERGEGVSVDRERAARLYREAAEAGHPESAVNLGRMHLTADEPVAARGWFEAAAANGAAEGMFHLGALLLTGDALPAEPDLALDWLTRAARKDSAPAAYMLGLAYLGEFDVTADPRDAVRHMRDAARAGYARAQHVLGTWYLEGRLVPESAPTARTWLARAGDQGLAEAQYLVGWLLHAGRGVEQDHVEALGWIRSAAEQGLAIAQTNLGLMLLRGEGAERDVDAAERWLRAAADQGFALAEYNLGLLHTKGEVGTLSSGRHLLERAADHGSTDAAARLALMDRAPASSGLAALRP